MQITIMPSQTPTIPVAPQVGDEQCAWCWNSLHPDQPYPESWSSTICLFHTHQMIQCQQARRRAKLKKAEHPHRFL